MTLRKLCLLLFATAPEKGSFRAFLTVRKIFFLPFVPNTDNGQKSAENVCYCVCYYFFLFFLRCGFRPEIRRKTTISCGFSLELIAGFEPATSSLPRKRSTSLKGITLPFFRQQKPQDIVVFLLSSYYHETFANFLIAFLSANVCKYLVLDRFIAV